jgi:hypothetical protein
LSAAGTPLGYAVDGVGGFALGLFGVWVLSLRPRTQAATGLGLLAAGFGLATTLGNLAGVGAWGLVGPAFALASILLALATAGVLLLGASFPRKAGRAERRLLFAALAGGAAVAGVEVLVVAASGPLVVGLAGVPGDVRALATLYWEALGALMGAVWAVMFYLALRYRSLAAEPAHARAAAVATVALSLYPAAFAARHLADTDPRFHAFTAVSIAAMAVLALLWARNAASGRSSSAARNVALFVPAWGLVTIAQAVATGGEGLFGLARILAVLVLGYAILRRQLLGLDLKVKWTIKQSTVAAAFIGVFFVVSEGATTFFQQAGLGPYLGIAAAGLLVFAIAPLQRAADRVASAAMPGVKSPAQMTSDERCRAYAELARVAWADGNLSSDERDLLDAARQQLGIGVEDAQRLEREAHASAKRSLAKPSV